MAVELKNITYTKDSGDTSNRHILVVSGPRDNYLVYDVTNLSDDDLDLFMEVLDNADTYRANSIKDFELITGVKVDGLWRSFKPGGIDWKE